MTFKRLMTSCFGLGLMPIASGTWGSLPVPVVYWLGAALGMPLLWMIPVMAGIGLVFSYACVAFAPEVIARTGKKDPGEVVADEVAGQAVTLMILSLYLPLFKEMTVLVPDLKTQLIILGTAFLAFRAFDIIKPPPCRRLEKLPAGWGILADDLMAGVYAGIVSCVIVHMTI